MRSDIDEASFEASYRMILWILVCFVLVCSTSPFFPDESFNNPLLERRCSGRACNPRMGNLAQGRLLTTQSVCGSNSSELYCFYKHTSVSHIKKSCPAVKCSHCNAAIPSKAHPPSDMSDSSFRSPGTWWQSAEGAMKEELQLDLETEFLFTHLILVFRSPRPAAMVLERSQDYGQTWKTLRYFARSCKEVFGVAEGAAVRESEATCTSKYSGAYPCSKGEVIYRALSMWHSVDPYGPAAQDQLMITNLRVRLLQSQPCPCKAKRPTSLPTHYFAVYDFIVKGSCLCNGHADHCVQANGYQPSHQKPNGMVHGKCVCRHNTAGDHCERCALLYNDRPWQAANGITAAPHDCRKCKCNGHAQSCRFSRRLWLASGRQSGGVCDDCRHNTEGRHCQSCKKGFYRDPGRPRTAADSCRACSCHPVGSVVSGGLGLCNPGSGECTCKPGVGGPHCDGCVAGYFGLHEYGCRPCVCTGDCDPYTGDCISGSEGGVSHSAACSSNSDTALFGLQELFSALHHSEKCECVETRQSVPKLLCTSAFHYVLVVKVLSAHDKGSHAEVEAKVKKVLHRKHQLMISEGIITLYPESWTTHGCTCPLLNPGSEYVVAGHEDKNSGRLMLNAKSFVKAWRMSLGKKILHILRKDCQKFM